MNLKTLKDLEVHTYEEDEGKFPKVEIEELKSEAVKWVKHIDEAILWHRTDYRENCQKTGVTSGQLFELQTNFEGQKLALINFFNLAEADLQEKK